MPPGVVVPPDDHARAAGAIRMKLNDAVFGAVLLLLGIVILVHVQSFPRIPGQQYGPALFPGVTAAGLVVCGILLIVGGIRARGTAPWFAASDWTRSPRHALAFLAILGGAVAYMLWADDLGFLLLAPLVLFAWFIALHVRPATAALFAVVATAVIWYAFYKLLRVPLPWGLLKAWSF
jgi:putative tricarboxylic transport membrane protein